MLRSSASISNRKPNFLDIPFALSTSVSVYRERDSWRFIWVWIYIEMPMCEANHPLDLRMGLCCAIYCLERIKMANEVDSIMCLFPNVSDGGEWLLLMLCKSIAIPWYNDLIIERFCLSKMAAESKMVITYYQNQIMESHRYDWIRKLMAIIEFLELKSFALFAAQSGCGSENRLINKLANSMQQLISAIKINLIKVSIFFYMLCACVVVRSYTSLWISLNFCTNKTQRSNEAKIDLNYQCTDTHFSPGFYV